MFKKILQASAQSLLSRPKIMRLAFFTLVCFSIVRLYYLIYYFNTILIWKYESGVQISDALMYFINTLNEHHAIGTIIVAIIIIIILALKSVYDLLKLISAITKILKHIKAGGSRTH